MAASIKVIVQSLVQLFTGLLMLTLMFAGLVMMFKPERGREVLKTSAIAAVLFFLGVAIVRSCLEAQR